MIIRFLEAIEDGVVYPTVTECVELGITEHDYLFITRANGLTDYVSTKALSSLDKDHYAKWTKDLFLTGKLDLVDDYIGNTYQFETYDEDEDIDWEKYYYDHKYEGINNEEDDEED